VVLEYRRQLDKGKIDWKRGLGQDELLLSVIERLGRKTTKGENGFVFHEVREAHLRGRTASRLEIGLKSFAYFSEPYYGNDDGDN
jgi:hypothetical protein